MAEETDSLGLTKLRSVPRLTAQEVEDITLAQRMGRGLARRGMQLVIPGDFTPLQGRSLQRAYQGEQAVMGNQDAYEQGKLLKASGQKLSLDWPADWTEEQRQAFLRGYEDEPRPGSEGIPPQTSSA